MAKLSTTLSLYDNFSNKLTKVNSTLQKSSTNMGKFSQLFDRKVGRGLFNSVQSGFRETDSAMSRLSAGAAAKIGIISGIAQSVTSSAIGSIRSLSNEMMGELSAASATWQTFEGNMAVFGKSKKEIAGVKKELQAYAEQTIYSSSDMASTYAQLAAVGVKNTTQLVKGFGGLASAAENPQQAMKTLSQQATQMAAKPMVQWQDFKLMLEQTPAGIAAVAKTMGMSTSEIVTAVQDGKVATEDFFDAIANTGTNEAFSKMATEFKTIGQAADGLKEGLTNKLQPAFDTASKYGINFVSSLADRIDAVNFNGLIAWIDEIAPKVEKGLNTAIDNVINFVPKAVGFISSGFALAKKSALEFWDSFKDTGALDSIKSAMSAIGDAFKNVTDNLPKDSSFLETLGSLAGKGVGGIAKMIEDFATSISKLTPDQLKSIGDSIRTLVEVFALFKYGKAALLGSALALIAKGISKLSPSQMEWAAKGIVALVGAFAAFKIANGAFKAIDGIKGLFGSKGGLPGSPGGGGPTEQVKGLTEGLNSLAKSAGIALVIGSLAGLALALKPLAELGPSAVAPLVAFGAVVGGLAGVLALAGTKLSTSAVGIGVFAASLSVLALSLSVIANAGENGVRNMATFGLVIGGLVAVFALFGQMLNLAIPGMLAFGATMLMVGAAMLLATPAIMALPPLVDSLGVAFVNVAGAIGAAVVSILGAVGVLITQVATGMALVALAIGESIATAVGSVTDLIAEIGDSLTQLIDSVSGGLIGLTDAVSGGITAVVDAVGGAISGVLDSIAGIFESIGTAALNAGTGMNLMADAFVRIGEMGAWDLAKTIGAVAKAMKDLSANGDALLTTAEAMQQLVASFELMGTTVTETMTASQLAVTVGMALMVTAFETGMTLSLTAVTSGSTAIVAAFTGLQAQLFAAGMFAMAGLTSGIVAGSGAAISAARSVANQVSSTIRNALDINSPSRVMVAIGGFVTEGLANGILKAKQLVEKASATLAIAAKPDFSRNDDAPETDFSSSVYLEDDEIARLRASASQNVVIENKQVVPQVSIFVDNKDGEPIDEEALLEKFEDKIIDLMESDMG